MNLDDYPEILTVGQVGDILEVSRSAARDYMKKGLFPCYKTPGGTRRCRKEDLIAYLERNNVVSWKACEPPPRAETHASTTAPSLLIIGNPFRYEPHLTLMQGKGMYVAIASTLFQGGIAFSQRLTTMVAFEFIHLGSGASTEAARCIKALHPETFTIAFPTVGDIVNRYFDGYTQPSEVEPTAEALEVVIDLLLKGDKIVK